MPESVPCETDPALNSFIDNVITHETKLVLAGLFLTHATRYFTEPALLDLFTERQGGRQDGIHDQNLIYFCRQDLETAGVVVDEPDGLHANPQQRMKRLALTGLALDWSLRWPDISVQSVYGLTKKAAAGTAPSNGRSPSLRQAIFDMVYAHETTDEPISTAELARSTGRKFQQVSSHVRRLCDVDILEKEAPVDDYAVRILDTAYTAKHVPLEKTSAETQAFYGALRQKGLGETSLRQLVAIAKDINPAIDAAKLTKSVRSTLLQRAGTAGLKLADGVSKNGRQPQSGVRFSDTARRPMHELVEGIAAVRNGERLALLAERCREIVFDKTSFRALTSKGEAWSPFDRRRGRPDPQTVLSSLFEAFPDGLPAKEAHRLVLQRHPEITWSQKHVQRLLGEFVGHKQLSVRREQRDPFRPGSVNVYYPAPETGQDDGSGREI